MLKTVYAVEITLTKITYDADHFGARLAKPSIVTTHKSIESFYSGAPRTMAAAMTVYGAAKRAAERKLR